MGLIDSHAHVTYPEFAGRIEEVLARCDAAGVERIITIGTSLSDARSAIALAQRFPARIHPAAGFHPHHADAVTDEDFRGMKALWDDPRVVAFGEMGLDYHYDFADRGRQKEVFARQLRMAAENASRCLRLLALPSPPVGERGTTLRERPLIIHAREAHDDVEAMLVDHGFEGRKVVFHCFTGTRAEAERIAARGWRISFTGIVTFPKTTELQEIARAYPADQLMVETDSPYLSPVPVRSMKPNEPCNVAHVARFLARLRGVAYEELVATTNASTRAFFGL